MITETTDYEADLLERVEFLTAERDAARVQVARMQDELAVTELLRLEASTERDELRAALVSLVDGKSEFDIEYDTGMDASEARKIMDLAYNR